MPDSGIALLNWLPGGSAVGEFTRVGQQWSALNQSAPDCFYHISPDSKHQVHTEDGQSLRRVLLADNMKRTTHQEL